MEDYDYFELPAQGTWADRFPADAAGSQELQGLPISVEGNREAWRRLTQVRTGAMRTPRVPRLFVSHRQCNRDYALRAAWIATQEG
jgi:hypothetical protein